MLSQDQQHNQHHQWNLQNPTQKDNVPLLQELEEMVDQRNTPKNKKSGLTQTTSEVGKFLRDFVQQSQSKTSQSVANDSLTGSHDHNESNDYTQSHREETRIMRIKSTSKDRTAGSIDSHSNHKQVRFNIIDGIRHVFKESNIDLDHVSERSLNVNQLNPKPSQQHNLRVTQVSTERAASRSKSPKFELKFQKPPQPVPKANNKLALQYKRGAEESRKKRGIEPSLQEKQAIEDDNNAKKQEQRASLTPNFSLEAKQFETDNLSPDKSRPLPLPMGQPVMRLEAAINQNLQLDQPKSQRTNYDSQAAGTIVKRNDNSRQRDLSQTSSQISKQPGQILRQRSTSPGDIWHIQSRNKENMSVIMNSSGGGILNTQGFKAGQIVRRPSSSLNQSFTANPPPPLPHQLATPLQQPKQDFRFPVQGGPTNQLQSINDSLSKIQPYTPQVKLNQSIFASQTKNQQAIQYSQPQQQILYQNFNNNNNIFLDNNQEISDSYESIWNVQQLNPYQALANLEQIKNTLEQNRQTTSHILTQLNKYSNSHIQNSFNQTRNSTGVKLSIIRTIVKNTYKSELLNQIQQILDYNNRLYQRKKDLLICLKQVTLAKKLNKQNSQETLKMEILKDICSRLIQKITIKAMLLNISIRKNINQCFNFYHSQYIEVTYKTLAFQHLKQYYKIRHSKKQYSQYGSVHVNQIKKAQIFYAWRNIKEFQNKSHSKLQDAVQILLSRKLIRVVTGWKIFIIQKRNKDLANQIAEKRQELKYGKLLFLRWVKHHKQHTKIKRKAAMMINQPKDQQLSLRKLDYSDESFNKQILRLEETFNSSIQEVLLEREHNKTFVSSLKFKTSGPQLDEEVPLQFSKDNLLTQKQSFAQVQNNAKIYRQYPQLRNIKAGSPLKKFTSIMKETRFDSPSKIQIKGNSNGPVALVNSMDEDTIGIKYSIHSAYVQQQNIQLYNQQLDQPNSEQSTNQPQGQKPIIYKQLMPPMPQRMIVHQQQEENSNLSVQAPAPNKFFEELESQLQQLQQKKGGQLTSYQDKHSYLPLDIQVKEHAQQLIQYLKVLTNLPVDYHFSVGLKSQSKSNMNQDDNIYGISDYIQYGLTSAEPRMTFIKMAQKKQISVLFTQWKAKFLKKWLNHDLHQIQWLNSGKQSIKAWGSLVKSRKQRANVFYHTKKVQRFYKLFQKWADANRQLIYVDIQTVRLFRKKFVFKHWLTYLEGQGHLLQKILRSQQYYQQALLSKTFISLCFNYYKAMKIKNFRNRKIFKKFFKRKWITKFKQIRTLRILITKISNKSQFQDRLKYQQQYEALQYVFSQWKQGLTDKNEKIMLYSALNHYKQSIIQKYFGLLKLQYKTSKGLKSLQNIQLKFKNTAFQKLKQQSRHLIQNQQNWENYRLFYLKSQVLMRWREQTMQNKLADMFFKRRILKALSQYVYHKCHIQPSQYYNNRLKLTFINELRNINREKWGLQKQDIILNSMIRNRNIQTKKVVFLKLLENILLQKKKRIIKSTILDFKVHNLKEKSFVILKNYYKAQQKEKIFNHIAKKNYAKLMSKRQKKQQNFYERQQYGSGMSDEHMLLARVLSSWKIFCQESIAQKIVFTRYVTYKQRMTLLRCMLSWRSIARYEQSLKSSSNFSSANPFNMPLAYSGGAHHPRQSNSVPTLHTQKPQYSSQQSLGQNIASQKQIPMVMHENSFSNKYKEQPVLEQQDLESYKTDLQNDKSLFDELEHIFTKNKKWLDEQKEREDFLREMATHYNQTLSNEMSTLRYSTELQNTKLIKKPSNTGL